MGIRYYKPTSPGRRNASVSDFSELTDKNKKPEKRLTEPLKKTGGRNHHGVVTVRSRGGGHKRMYRIIDFRRNDRDGQPAQVHVPADEVRGVAQRAVQAEPGGAPAGAAVHGDGERIVRVQHADPVPVHALHHHLLHPGEVLDGVDALDA